MRKGRGGEGRRWECNSSERKGEVMTRSQRQKKDFEWDFCLQKKKKSIDGWAEGVVENNCFLKNLIGLLKRVCSYPYPVSEVQPYRDETKRLKLQHKPKLSVLRVTRARAWLGLYLEFALLHLHFSPNKTTHLRG